MTSPTYPFDITGLEPTNLITDETYTINSIYVSGYRILIPIAAPFYLDNLVLKYITPNGSVVTLIEDIDYYLCLPYITGTRAIGKVLHGGILLLKDYLTGSFKLTYQTLGGSTLGNPNAVMNNIISGSYNAKGVLWDVVTDNTKQFPAVDLRHHRDFVYGKEKVVEALTNIGTAITTASTANTGLVTHLADHNNPHLVNKLQVGLGNVANYPIATDAEVAALTPVYKYVTLKQLIDLVKTVATPPPMNNTATGNLVITNGGMDVSGTSGVITVGDALTANTSGIADVDGLGAFNYIWSVNGIKVGSNASTYTTTASDIGYQIKCDVDFIDALGNSEAKTATTQAQVTAAAPKPAKPTITSPVNNAVISMPFTFTSSAFVGSSALGVHGHSHWAIAGSSGALFGGAVDNVNLTSIAATAADLPPGTYSITVQYGEGAGVGGGGQHSDVSDPVTFTVT